VNRQKPIPFSDKKVWLDFGEIVTYGTIVRELQLTLRGVLRLTTFKRKKYIVQRLNVCRSLFYELLI